MSSASETAPAETSEKPIRVPPCCCSLRALSSCSRVTRFSRRSNSPIWLCSIEVEAISLRRLSRIWQCRFGWNRPGRLLLFGRNPPAAFGFKQAPCPVLALRHTPGRDEEARKCPGTERQWRLPRSESHLGADFLQNERPDSGHAKQVFGTSEGPEMLPGRDDTAGEDRADPRDLLQFLDLCPIHVHE